MSIRSEGRDSAVLGTIATSDLVDEQSSVSAVSWAAIIGGAVAAIATTLILLVLGTGLGLTMVSPWYRTGASAATIGVTAIVWLVVVQWLSSAIGGYLAGRLRTKWSGVHTHEVYFRDTAHGFLAWAFATVLSAAVLASAAAQIVGGASTGLAQAAGSAAGQSTSTGPMDGYIDTMLRADPSANRTPAEPAGSRSELARLLSSSLRDGGDLSAGDRTYVAQVVASRTGLSTVDAEKRVSDVVTQAKMAVDNARKAAAYLALWLTLSLLIGAFSASLAATEGGGLRDGTWNSRLRHS